MRGSCGETSRLQAAGIINSLKKSEWLSVADELSNLSAEDYAKVIKAFGLYRESIQIEKSNLDNLPQRRDKHF